MILKTTGTPPDYARRLMAVMMSIVFIAAGGALAKNHDAQRVRREASSDHARHDRAAGPLEASNAFDRSAD